MTNLVLTPGGYKPRNLVHHVPALHGVRMRGMLAEIVHPDGRVLNAVGEIAPRETGRPLMPGHVSRLLPDRSLRHPSNRERPPFFGGSRGEDGIPRTEGRSSEESRGGIDVLERTVPFATIDGWVSYSSWSNTTGNPISRFATTWEVPAEPANAGDQTIFLFNGIQNSTMIYQPVLQWGPSAAGGGQYWSIASWYADGETGVSFHTDLVNVNVGDVLVGVMTLTGESGGKFSYNCEFTGIGNTSLPISDVEELTWAIETLEAYGVTACGDYPAVSKTRMRQIAIETSGTNPALTWTANDPHGDCGAHTAIVSNSTSDGIVDIWYKDEFDASHWEARHGLTSDQFQSSFDDLVGNQGMELICISGYEDGGEARYAAIWAKTASPANFTARHGLTSAQHQQLFTDLPGQGYFPVLVNGYSVNGEDFYASIWHSGGAGEWAARHGLSAADYQRQFDELTSQGFVPVWVSGYGNGDEARYAAVFQKSPPFGDWQARHGLSAADYQATFDSLTSQGYEPYVVSGYDEGGSGRYAAIFAKPPRSSSWQARHGIDAADYQQLFNDLPTQQLRPVLVNGFNVAGNVGFASIWEK